MGRLLFLCIFISLETLAYAPGKTNLTNSTFLRYVRPQLRTISNEYKTLFFAINENLKMFAPSYSKVHSLFYSALDFQEFCQKYQESKCFPILNKMRDEVLAVQKSLYAIEFSSESTEFDMILLRNDLEIMKDDFLKLKIYLDSIRTQINLTGELKDKIDLIVNQVARPYMNFNLILLKHSDKRFKNSFHLYWRMVVHPLGEFVIHKQDKEYLLSNLKDLNIIVNELNIQLTKRNHTISKQAFSLTTIMHNRWNNVLKLTLKTE